MFIIVHLELSNPKQIIRHERVKLQIVSESTYLSSIFVWVIVLFQVQLMELIGMSEFFKELKLHELLW